MTKDNAGNSRNPLDMTLDELIRTNRTNISSQQPGRGRGRPPRGRGRSQSSSAGRPVNRREQQPPRNTARPRPYNPRGTQETTKTLLSCHNYNSSVLFIDFIKFLPCCNWHIQTRFNHRGGAVVQERGTVKIYISNLSYKVDTKDIDDLFSERGRVTLNKSAVHYNEEGRSMGTAEVVFSNRGDAMSAMQKYNLRLLDGRPLRLEIVDREMRNEFPRGGRGRSRGMSRVRGRRQAANVDAGNDGDGDITNNDDTDMELDL